MVERSVQRSKAVQVGMLMRAYRESFMLEDSGRGLTQEELLRRMAAVDSDYGQRYSHTTVSRWESGVTRPSKERLEVFGRALNLSQPEIDGLMMLAGLQAERGTSASPAAETDYDTQDAAASLVCDEFNPPADAALSPAGSAVKLDLARSIKIGVVSCLLPGMAIVGGGYLLASLGWDASWMPIAYVGSVILFKLATGYLRLCGPYDLCEFMCISLFVLLSTPLLQAAAVNMDHYGFFAIGDFAGTQIPYMLALLLNLAVSSSAGVLHFFMWRWQYNRPLRDSNPVRRAALVVIPPMVLVYAVMAVATNIGILAQLGLVLSVFSAASIIMVWLRDPDVRVSENDRRFLLWSSLIVCLAVAIFWLSLVFAVYVSPDLPSILPDHNLLFRWQIDYSALGFNREEAMNRFNSGYIWHGTGVFIYLVFVVGGNLLSAVYNTNSSGGSRGSYQTAGPSSRGGQSATTQ